MSVCPPLQTRARAAASLADEADMIDIIQASLEVAQPGEAHLKRLAEQAEAKALAEAAQTNHMETLSIAKTLVGDGAESVAGSVVGRSGAGAAAAAAGTPEDGEDGDTFALDYDEAHETFIDVLEAEVASRRTFGSVRLSASLLPPSLLLSEDRLSVSTTARRQYGTAVATRG